MKRAVAAAILLAWGAWGSRAADTAAAAEYSRSRGGDVLLVWERGRLFADCRPGTTPATAFPVMSLTKSLTALAYLANRDPTDALPLLRQISGTAPGYSLYAREIRNVRSAAARLPMRAAGTFAYGPSHYEKLGDLAWRDDPRPVSRWLGSMGIVPSAWRTDRTGNEFLSAGAVLSALDMLRIARLILDRGRAGWRRIVSPAGLAVLSQGSDANPAYGAGFWLNTNAARADAREGDIECALRSGTDWRRFCLSRNAPTDLMAMAGSGGQRVYIIPSRKLAIVRLGKKNEGFRDADFLRALLAE